MLPGATAQVLEISLIEAKECGEEQFTQFLLDQGLAPLWDQQLEVQKPSNTLSPRQQNVIHQNRLHATGTYLIQRHNLQRVKNILDKAGLSHVVSKGAHTRELYYNTPALRPAVDIDILVRPQDKIAAIRAFQEEGFEFFGVADIISHECSLIKGKTTIDLHWDILRPGRTRQPMINELLNSRVDYGSHWGMNHSANLFMMLVHPVFTKYSTTPHASLCRLVDMALLLDKNLADPTETIQLLNTAGLTTAGWITAYWFTMLTGSELCAELADKLKPGRMRQRYLKNWLHSNRSSKLLDKPLRIQLGFTLPAHDRISDAVRAVRQARQCKRQSQKTLAELEQAL